MTYSLIHFSKWTLLSYKLNFNQISTIKILLKIRGFSFRFLLALVSLAYCNYLNLGFCNIVETNNKIQFFPFKICCVREISLSLCHSLFFIYIYIYSHIYTYMYTHIHTQNTVNHIPTKYYIMLEKNHNTFVLLAVKLFLYIKIFLYIILYLHSLQNVNKCHRSNLNIPHS